MRILLTNDDGIHAEGLKVLAEWARTKGEVMIFAPKYEQSAKSHAIQIHAPFEAKQVEHASGLPAWSIDSTPADCVRFAVLGLRERFDLVISGINRGLNIGRDIIYSGTVSAAFEAASLGIKGIALSTEPKSFDDAKAHLNAVWDFLTAHGLLEKGDVYNINIPCDTDGKIHITRQGGPYYSDDFPCIGNNMYRPTGKSIYSEGHDPHLDTDVTLHGGISISPLTYDRTDFKAFGSLLKEQTND
jgi:5'-nucleotidase